VVVDVIQWELQHYCNDIIIHRICALIVGRMTVSCLYFSAANVMECNESLYPRC